MAARELANGRLFVVRAFLVRVRRHYGVYVLTFPTPSPSLPSASPLGG